MSTRLIAAAMALSLAAAPAMAQTKQDTGPSAGPSAGPSVAALVPAGTSFTALVGLLAFAGLFGAGVIVSRKRTA